ncbi:hypothetical protein KR222_008466 [Zaprionus bogoriensis]|nr:hypothetical protein KR222_008466 [Zaprionus bogoriensis]
MVLTSFECWAHGASASADADAVHFENGPATRQSAVVDPFSARAVSHIASASNGYYGYAIVNNDAGVGAAAAAAPDDNNNSCGNNNMVQAMQVSGAAAADVAAEASARCKKRCFAVEQHHGHGLDMEMDNLTAVKRCRYDDADLVAQYCNDFFSLPATQMIGTQACLMDYDCDVQQQQSQQQQPPQPVQQQQQQQHPRSIHQHYQGHLHRANRDVSRCMMSHMI